MKIKIAMFTPYHAISARQSKDTGLAIVLVCLLLAHVFRLHEAFYEGAIVALLMTMTVPSIFKLPAVVWFGFSDVLGYVMSRIILSIIFFGLVTPLGISLNWVRKDPLKIKQFRGSVGSVFRDRDYTYSKEDLDHPY